MPPQAAEYKQVTVLFADVVHSMDLAARVGPERLREIMSELFDCVSSVVTRYGGTVDKFTGDGVMAVFGAPVTLEDHAFRACLAALEVQREVGRLGLGLRVGLNSGQVIAGGIGSGAGTYTTIGDQVGMAQRMESVAPAGGVMLSESTARLVENTTRLGEWEQLPIKGFETPVPVRRLLGVADQRPTLRIESALVGRTWEMRALLGVLDEATDGAGCVVGIMGPPGIGKSRLVREVAAEAARRGIEVFSTYCESHSSEIPFHALAQMIRAAIGVSELAAASATDLIRERFPEADPEDVLLLGDLAGVADPAGLLTEIAPDARRRRMTALINGAWLARSEPAVYLIEDAHWMDQASESMLAEFLPVIPQTSSLVIVTYRPEYHGALTRVPGSQTIALRPLSKTNAATLTQQLLGNDSSLGGLAARLTDRSAGNPFFAEEMVRNLAERRVLEGERGAYRLCRPADDVEVPATLQATLGARIDRLPTNAKHTLTAAAVIGLRFDADLLGSLVDEPDLGTLIDAELIDQVRFTSVAEYVFRHPLICAVAYEVQLKSARAQLHRRLAGALERRSSGDESGAVIAEHLEAAGDLRSAFDWHMRAAAWSLTRDFFAAQTSWRRARDVADRLPDDDPDTMALRIQPRTLLCGTAAREGTRGAGAGFDELFELCSAAGDQQSLAVGMSGMVTAKLMNLQRREASALASDLVRLLDSIGDPTLTLALSFMVMAAEHEVCAMTEVLRLAERAIELAEGDPIRGNLIISSPLALAISMRGVARLSLGLPGWREDLHEGARIAAPIEPIALSAAIFHAYITGVSYGALPCDETVLSDTATALQTAEAFGDNFALDLALTARGVVLIHQGGRSLDEGRAHLLRVREEAVKGRFTWTTNPLADTGIAWVALQEGDCDAAVHSLLPVSEELTAPGSVWAGWTTAVLVEALLQRGADGDLERAQRAIDRLAAVPTEPGFVLFEITNLRLATLLARARGDDAAYRARRDRYRALAHRLGFESHMAMAQAMP